MADMVIAQDPHVRPVLVEGNPTLAQVTDDVASIPEQLTRPPREWYIALAATGGITLVLLLMLTYLVFTGIGV
ncbi:MAG TPA: hypothetical protein VFL57_04875, partial [Bryobacteraceae bacterium]|nr:hypothetical protein [Bryobacteraceae bacterium]